MTFMLVVYAGSVLVTQGSNEETVTKRLRGWIDSVTTNDVIGLDRILERLDIEGSRVARDALCVGELCHHGRCFPIVVRNEPDDKAGQRALQPGSLALIRRRPDHIKCRVESVTPSTLMAHVRITARKGRTVTSRKIVEVPWGNLLPRK
jgi:hypothetical protein